MRGYKNTGFPGPWATVVKFVAGLYLPFVESPIGLACIPLLSLAAFLVGGFRPQSELLVMMDRFGHDQIPRL